MLMIVTFGQIAVINLYSIPLITHIMHMEK